MLFSTPCMCMEDDVAAISTSTMCTVQVQQQRDYTVRGQPNVCGVIQNIDPPPHHRPAGVCVPPPPLLRGEDTLAV
jgi:hypothetical protein